jgi:endoglucanase
MLNRRKLFPLVRTALLALFGLAAGVQAETAADRFQPKRGLNLEIWNEWLTADEMVTRPGFLDIYPDWRRIVPPEKVNELKTLGFDFLRLPFDPAPLLRLGPGPAQDALIDQIAQTVTLVHSAGLKAIVDLHSIPRPDEDWGTDTIVGDPTLFDAHVALVAKVAARLNGMDPDRTAFELLNEPTGDCDAIYGKSEPMQWPGQLARLHAAARSGAPDLPLVLSGACWGGMDGLDQIDPASFGDENLIFSFHSYDPFLFTHQAASWSDGPNALFADVPYPPEMIDDTLAARLVAEARARAKAANSDIDPAALEQAMADYRSTGRAIVETETRRAADWADKHGIPRSRLLLGEFGAMREDMSGRRFQNLGRETFLADKRQAAEAQGIGWAVWVWTGTFGITEDDQSRQIAPATCAALGLAGCPE